MENSTEAFQSTAGEVFDKDKFIMEGERRSSGFQKIWNISNNIQGYTLMITIPIGIVLNVLTIFTFLKIKFNKTTAGIHLLCLAISEVLLLVGFGISWHWPYKFNFTHTVFCMIENFLVLSQQTWSSLLMVTLTVERFFAITFPLKFKKWNAKRISKVSIVCFAIVSCIFGCLSAARTTLFEAKDHNRCKHNPDFEELNNFFDSVATRILLYGSCPVLTFIFTVLIANQLYKQRKVRNTMVQEGPSVAKHKEFMITLMLFLVACMFLISKIFQTTIWYLLVHVSKSSVHFKHAAIASHYARIVLVLNHSLNSLVCLIFLKSFRKAFVSLICCKWRGVKIEPTGNTSLSWEW